MFFSGTPLSSSTWSGLCKNDMLVVKNTEPLTASINDAVGAGALGPVVADMVINTANMEDLGIASRPFCVWTSVQFAVVTWKSQAVCSSDLLKFLLFWCAIRFVTRSEQES